MKELTSGLLVDGSIWYIWGVTAGSSRVFSNLVSSRIFVSASLNEMKGVFGIFTSFSSRVGKIDVRIFKVRI